MHFSSAAPRYLRYKLKRTLAASVIGKMQAHIRIENPYERDGGEIMPFGDHLRADENIRAVFAEFFQNFEMPFFTRSGIVVHSENAGGRKTVFQFRFHALRACAGVGKVRAAAFGAAAKHFIPCAAIVAF